MSPGIQFEFHFWRGWGPTTQHDLFFYGYRFGFATVSVCKECVIESYSKLRAAVTARVDADEKRVRDEEEGR